MNFRRGFLSFLLLLAGVSPPLMLAGELTLSTDSDSGFQVVDITHGETQVKFVPAAGANVYSLRVAGVEYFRQPASLRDLPGVGFGNPVLYPTPNRVRDAKFTFNDREVRFKPNAGKHHIHGLVNREAWTIVETSSDEGRSSVKCKLSFAEGTSLGDRFPFPHQLFLTVTVTNETVRWTYEVDNTNGSDPVPYGFALHPYFVYQGERASTFLTIPATHWMEAENQLPTGRLLPGDRVGVPFEEPFSLKGTKLDDVFFGLTPQQPTTIDFRDVGRRVTIVASDAFTHLVVWTPDRPYFGIESQTCSTDAHNLHALGYERAAHLQICEPGGKQTGWVEYRFSHTSDDSSGGRK
ncbi:MAG: aldose 1-epimerase [Pirellulaceae bacterium]